MLQHHNIPSMATDAAIGPIYSRGAEHIKSRSNSLPPVPFACMSYCATNKVSATSPQTVTPLSEEQLAENYLLTENHPLFRSKSNDIKYLEIKHTTHTKENRRVRINTLSPEELLEKICKKGTLFLVDIDNHSTRTLAKTDMKQTFHMTESRRRLKRTRKSMARIHPPLPGDLLPVLAM